jgi:hypothetical protein
MQEADNLSARQSARQICRGPERVAAHPKRQPGLER